MACQKSFIMWDVTTIVYYVKKAVAQKKSVNIKFLNFHNSVKRFNF